MLNHISEDDLVLFHYGEPGSGEARTHLEGCAECRSRLASLQAVLGRLDDDVIPEPGPGYEDLVWQRLRWQMRSRRNPEVRSSFKAAAAAAILLAIGFAGGRYVNSLDDRPVTSPAAVASTTTTPAQAPAPADPLTMVAHRHFERSSRLLRDVKNQTASGDLAVEQTAADELLASNRLYRVVAEQNGAQEVADMLETIEPILLELAHSEGRLSPEALKQLQTRITEHELLFRLRVVKETLRERQAARGQAQPVVPTAPIS